MDERMKVGYIIIKIVLVPYKSGVLLSICGIINILCYNCDYNYQDIKIIKNIFLLLMHFFGIIGESIEYNMKTLCFILN